MSLFKSLNRKISRVFGVGRPLRRSKMTSDPDISFPSVEPSERRLPWPALSSSPPDPKTGSGAGFSLLNALFGGGLRGIIRTAKRFVKNRDGSERLLSLNAEAAVTGFGGGL